MFKGNTSRMICTRGCSHTDKFYAVKKLHARPSRACNHVSSSQRQVNASHESSLSLPTISHPLSQTVARLKVCKILHATGKSKKANKAYAGVEAGFSLLEQLKEYK